MRARLVALAAVTVLFAGCSSDGGASPSAYTGAGATGSTTERGSAEPQRLTFTAADGSTIQYVLLVPDGRAQGRPGKVLFTFPPGGQDIDLTERIVRDKWQAEALARDYVVVSPAAPSSGLYYSDPSAALVPELLDTIATEYPPEGGRFDLAGVSNGGLSAFKAALDHPERFRSLVVFPGYSPDGADDPDLAKLEHIGVAMFVGGDDAGWRDASETTQAELERLGYTVELHVVDDQGHILGDSVPGSDLFDAIERVRDTS